MRQTCAEQHSVHQQAPSIPPMTTTTDNDKWSLGHTGRCVSSSWSVFFSFHFFIAHLQYVQKVSSKLKTNKAYSENITGKSISHSAKSGLQFQVGCVHCLIVYLTAILKYQSSNLLTMPPMITKSIILFSIIFS